MSPHGSQATALLFGASVALGVLGLGALGVYGFDKGRRVGTARRFDQLVRQEASDRDGGDETPGRSLLPWLRWVGQQSETASGAAEIGRLLRQAGLRGRDAVALFAAARGLICAVAVLTTVITAVVSPVRASGLALGLVGFSVGAIAYLVPGMVLRTRASNRTRQIRDDVGLFTELLRLLFDAGLSLEQSLRVLVRDGRQLFAALSLELEVVLRQIEAGQDRQHALQDMADALAIPEVSDLVRMLGQIDQYGGSVRDPLMEFALLLEDRRRTEVQETVSRLSAKMTVVMVLCLFPALLILVAGPGMLALLRALERLNG